MALYAVIIKLAFPAHSRNIAIMQMMSFGAIVWARIANPRQLCFYVFIYFFQDIKVIPVKSARLFFKNA